MLRKYINVGTPSTTRIEATKKDWEYIVVFTIMWEEIMLRLDEKGFYLNQQSRTQQLEDAKTIEEYKNTTRQEVDGVKPEPTKDELQSFKEFQLELREKTMQRIEYIIDWVNCKELFDKIHNLKLKTFQDDIDDPIDNVVE